MTSLILAALLSVSPADAGPHAHVRVTAPPVRVAVGPVPRAGWRWVPARHKRGRVVPGHWVRVAAPVQVVVSPTAGPRVLRTSAEPPVVIMIDDESDDYGSEDYNSEQVYWVEDEVQEDELSVQGDDAVYETNDSAPLAVPYGG